MERCKWVPVSSHSSSLHVLLFSLTLTKTKPVPPTVHCKFTMVVALQRQQSSQAHVLILFVSLLPDSPESLDLSIWAMASGQLVTSLILNFFIVGFYCLNSCHNSVRSNSVIIFLFHSIHSCPPSLGDPGGYPAHLLRSSFISHCSVNVFFVQILHTPFGVFFLGI